MGGRGLCEECGGGQVERACQILFDTNIIHHDRTQEGKRQQVCDRNKTTLLFRIKDTL